MSVVIIGGGISGLGLAYALKRRGVESVVLESEATVGGKIRTRFESGFITEDGPNTFLDKEPALRECARSLGIERKLVPATPEARKRFLFRDGKLQRMPSSPPAFLKSELLSARAKLRVFGDLFAPRAAANTDESLASFARRRFGAEATRVLADAFQRGIFAGDLESLSVSAAFPKLKELEQEHRSLILGAIRAEKRRTELCSFEGGLEVLVGALAEAVRPSLRTSVRVTSISPTANGWTVEGTRLGEPISLEADAVVCCSPADASSGLVSSFDPNLARDLGSIRYAPVAVVHLGFSSELPAPEGFGFLVPASEKRALLGVIHASTIFPWRAPNGGVLLTCLLGGMLNDEVVGRSEAEVIAVARAELREIAGIDAEPSYRRAVRWTRAIPQYEVGHLERLKRIDLAQETWPGLFLSGNALRGPGVPDCVREAERLADRICASNAKVLAA